MYGAFAGICRCVNDKTPFGFYSVSFPGPLRRTYIRVCCMYVHGLVILTRSAGGKNMLLWRAMLKRNAQTAPSHPASSKNPKERTCVIICVYMYATTSRATPHTGCLMRGCRNRNVEQPGCMTGRWSVVDILFSGLAGFAYFKLGGLSA